MNELRSLHQHFQPPGMRRTVLNIILDGYGEGNKDSTNAVHLARTPYLDQLRTTYPSTQLWTHGTQVGLPTDQDMGGSEVGHLTLGAGQIIKQGAKRITEQIQDQSFFSQPALVEALSQAQNSSLHLLGLLSDGMVHSHISHMLAIIQAAAKNAVPRCYIHGLLDGRDVPIQSALGYVRTIEQCLAQIRSEQGLDYRFASGGGREIITMDRDQVWERIRLGWETHVDGESNHYFHSAEQAILHFREQEPQIIDQNIPPFNITDDQGKVVRIEDGDAVIFTNFRSDRAIEMTRAFVEEGFDQFPIRRRPKIFFVGMTVYDADNDTPKNRIMDGVKVAEPFGKRLVQLGLKQFRLAETQKFPHVTFFFNGGYKKPLSNKLETYHMIASDKIPSFDLAPEMQAFKIAAQAVKFLKETTYDYGLINLANPDMVAHSGNFEATVKAVEAVDQSLAMIGAEVVRQQGLAIITADHGNADEMQITNPKTGQLEPSTKHSLNPVNFLIVDPLYQQNYQLKKPSSTQKLNLSMVAATNFVLLGLPIPKDLNPSLLDIEA